MSQRETDSYLIERSLAVIPIQKKDKGGADLSKSFNDSSIQRPTKARFAAAKREHT